MVILANETGLNRAASSGSTKKAKSLDHISAKNYKKLSGESCGIPGDRVCCQKNPPCSSNYDTKEVQRFRR